MKTIGTYLSLAGVISCVLLLMDRNLSILMWIDNWGETTGWAIRIGFIVVGLAMFFLGKSEDEEVAVESPNTEG